MTTYCFKCYKHCQVYETYAKTLYVVYMCILRTLQVEKRQFK